MTDHSRLHTPDHDTDTEYAEQVRPPLLGASVWTAVTARAGGRCECTGECARPHPLADSDDYARGRGRCPAEQRPGRPLHAVPRTPVPPSQGAALGAEQLMAMCAPCHTRRDTHHTRTLRAAPTTDALFDLGEVTG
ncbi:hypothetical protein [Allonocardiopsis opalescens]|uniref:Uncharacterized protein n=1 Tax=Allonocardiopsis opalescens TaxID=1144618 RepID=A0A2T0Q984_9ACTN|nr:hypothetical protein [Allonocardiopsis opalescens]PRY00428.1 hypothetical protein CLV72_10257 [Allonocardiopsis opalescens]